MTDIAALRAQLAQLEAEWAAKAKAAKGLRRIDALQNEGGEGYSLADATAEQLANHYLPLTKALADQIFAAEWTPEVTAARRVAWNAEMRALEAKRTPINTKTLQEVSGRLGYTMTQLRLAMQINGIQ